MKIDFAAILSREKEDGMNPSVVHVVHALVDPFQPVRRDAVKGLLQSMLDPLSRMLALAPFDDECEACTINWAKTVRPTFLDHCPRARQYRWQPPSFK